MRTPVRDRPGVDARRHGGQGRRAGDEVRAQSALLRAGQGREHPLLDPAGRTARFVQAVAAGVGELGGPDAAVRRGLGSGDQSTRERILDALRDLQGILTDLGDLRAELTVLARYALAELDSEADLIRIVLAEARTRPELVDAAVEQLVTATYTGFASWLRTRTGLPDDEADAVAAVGLGALFSSRLLRLLLGRDPVDVPDQLFVRTWVAMVHDQIAP